ncbi:UNVERIFIED_CONTAM: Retrovirus-related Pol polyprotein from transposon.6 [Sesamum radiatum]|uniref:Retrovirus-related Pol polyprotein from transposon.6 n=1 Tax=Sesamum radiatum TaxID=300843 RepID=A0AAW2Q0Y6_SESRA
MTQLPILLLPDFNQPFDVTTDASQIAVGAVLSQQGQLVAFFGKKLTPQLQSTSTYVRELYAITEAVKKWRLYLLGHFFRIYTDHRSLKDLVSQTIQTPEQQKWLSKLLGFHYEIHYKPGKENVVADALSRIPQGPEYTAISSPTADIFQRLRDFYSTIPVGRELLAAVQAGAAHVTHLHFRAGLLYYKQRVFVPPESQLAFPLF